MKNTQKYIIAGLILIAVIAGSVYMLKRGAGEKVNWNGTQGEPAEIVTDFYQKWVAYQTANDGAVSRADFLATTPLSDGARAAIANADRAATDPVMCRKGATESMRVQNSFVTETAAQVLVLAPNADFNAGYAIVDLSGKDGSWQIEKVTCATGELVPEQKEFSFDFDGALMKQVPKPFISGKWHIIYKDATQQVGLVPLQIGPKTVCSFAGGKTVACDDTFLIEAADVHVSGSMTETGVDVARIERK